MEPSSVSGGEHILDNQPYVYTPLPAGDSFRCLALQPGSGDEPLQCSIHISAVADAEYEAISYVWGSEIRDCRIHCNNRTILITTNLFQALRRLRSPTDVRYLWADSVCINQGDDKEKGHQVSIMSQIYNRARRVLIYMGSDPEGHGPKVASLLSDVHNLLRGEMDNLVSFEWNCFPEPHEDTTKTLLHDKRWQSYLALLNLEWFRRGWVVREAGLAKEGLIIWGGGEFSWTDLMYTIHWIFGKSIAISALPRLYFRRIRGSVIIHLKTFWDRHHHILRIFFTRTALSTNRLLDYLAHGRHQQFKDPRDNVYAFLDLAFEPRYQIIFAPDYTQPPQEVFSAFAIQYLRTSGDITILRYVIHDTVSLQSDLPTWVPRWGAIESRHDNRFWATGFGSLQDAANPTIPEIIDGKILKIRGVVLDRVCFVSRILRKATQPDRIVGLWQEVEKSSFQTHLPVKDRCTCFIKAMLMNKMLSTDREENQRYIDTYVEELLRPADETGTHRWGGEGEYLKRFNQVDLFIIDRSRAKRLMLTERGHIGLVPIAARQGDVCVGLFGSTTLSPSQVYLLRTTETTRYHKFVGPAWSLYYMEPVHADSDEDSGQERRAGGSDNDNGEQYHQGVFEDESKVDHDDDQAVGEQDFYLC